MESLRRTFEHEIKNVVKAEEEIPFQMRKTESARKLIVKLQKFRYLEEKLKEKPNSSGIIMSGLSKYKDTEGDRDTVKRLLEELKEDLESYKAKCIDIELRRKLRNVIADVCGGIKYFSKIEIFREKAEENGYFEIFSDYLHMLWCISY